MFSQEPFDKELLSKMEAGNRKLYAKDMTSVALTTQHKRGVIGAYVEGKLKIEKPKTNESFNSQKKTESNRGRGGGRGGGRGRGGRGGGGRGGRGGKSNAKPDNKENNNKQNQPSRDAPKPRGEQPPPRSKKKLVDRLKDPHVQAIIRDQLETGDFLSLKTTFNKNFKLE